MANLIKHIAMRVISIEESKQFYETVFGYKHVNTVLRKGKHGDHISCHMTDGYMDLTLIHYESEDADEANFAGPAPCIHHIGVISPYLAKKLARIFPELVFFATYVSIDPKSGSTLAISHSQQLHHHPYRQLPWGLRPLA